MTATGALAIALLLAYTAGYLDAWTSQQREAAEWLLATVAGAPTPLVTAA